VTQTKEAIEKYLHQYGGDGWTILKPMSLVEMGFTPEFVQKHTKIHESGDAPKDTIFIENGIAAKLQGVYCLEFLYGIANDCGADQTEAKQKTGRGFQAGCLCRSVLKKIRSS